MQADVCELARVDQTIPRVLFRAAERFGDRSALEDGELRLSFAELAERGLDATRAFCAAGLRPGDRVGIWAPNTAEWVLAALGVLSAGGVIVTLNTRFKSGEAAYVLRKSGARMLFTVGEFLGTNYVEALQREDLPDIERVVVLRGECPGAESWEDFAAGADAVSSDEARARALSVSPEDLADLLFTSGTTGQPKAVMSEHGQNIRAFLTWTEVIGLRPEDRYLIQSPFFHSMGYKAGWLACLLRGTADLPHAQFDVEAVVKRVGSERVSVLVGPPTIFQSILAHPDRDLFDLENLRLAVTGAAAVPVELVHRMRDELGFESIITGYGLTEASGIVSMCRYDDDPETIATTSGRAIPDTEVRCVDGDGKSVPCGEPGELVVRGYNVMRGYFDDEAATAEAVDSDGWLHTGDIAVMDEQGYLQITDRIKDMFIVGGFNCYPAEIENILFGSGQYEQVAVIGVPDERLGEVGMAFVVPAPGSGQPTEESVIAWCRENMANYKVPRRVEVVDELPMNASGKVMKFLLRERAQA
jgi:acyl-CoA synthetase (AMP-forming)/AMP-acid ligase II